jgi:REP element-mobilizing transposase RayT
MTVARSKLVDVDVTRWYHVISKTVRGAFMLAEDDDNRKQWIEDRLQFLSSVFAIEVAGFAVMDNHLHLLVRLEPERVDQCFALLKTDADMANRGPVCWKAFLWAVMCSWSTTRAAWSVAEKPV